MLAQVPDYLDATLTMLKIGGIAIALALLVGVVNATLLQLNWPFVQPIIRSYVELGRNTPLLIQLFLLYFGLPAAGILLSAELCALLALTFLGGAYFTEVFRAGFSVIPPQQQQGALALGLSPLQSLRHILWPQVWIRQLPASAATACFLLRETTVVSAIAVAEIMYTTTSGIALYYTTYEFLALMTLCCLLIFLPLSYGLKQLENRWQYVG